ncbi:MAG: hypothetical protein M3326_14445 [Actinomycetota bacterium]|nr:hypothetical protein [Actinomycetota bacterium]
MRQVRRLAIGGVTTAAAGLLLAAAAWACVSGPALNLSTISAKPGQEVGITGTGFQTGNQVTIRWNALDGPVLTTVPAPITSGNLDAKFTVPEGTKPGSYVVIVTQNKADGTLSLSPIRAVMNVTGDAGAAPVVGAPAATADTSARANGLVRDNESISGGTLALVALGVGGVGMFLAGMAALFAGRRSSAPEAARARR